MIFTKYLLLIKEETAPVYHILRGLISMSQISQRVNKIKLLLEKFIFAKFKYSFLKNMFH